jgi:hypothetical protein
LSVDIVKSTQSKFSFLTTIASLIFIAKLAVTVRRLINVR